MFSYYDLGDDDLPGCFAGLIFHTVNTWTVLPSLSHCYEHCSDSKERLMSSQQHISFISFPMISEYFEIFSHLPPEV